MYPYLNRNTPTIITNVLNASVKVIASALTSSDMSLNIKVDGMSVGSKRKSPAEGDLNEVVSVYDVLLKKPRIGGNRKIKERRRETKSVQGNPVNGVEIITLDDGEDIDSTQKESTKTSKEQCSNDDELIRKLCDKVGDGQETEHGNRSLLTTEIAESKVVSVSPSTRTIAFTTSKFMDVERPGDVFNQETSRHVKNEDSRVCQDSSKSPQSADYGITKGNKLNPASWNITIHNFILYVYKKNAI